ncbi:MAG: hypothetical protein AAGC60_24600 [Acidobacteriota bacterium]
MSNSGGDPKSDLTMAARFGSPATTFAFGIRKNDGRYYRRPVNEGSFASSVRGRQVELGGGREPREGIDPKNLGEAGWGVVWSDGDTKTRIGPLLAPLLERREEQAGDRYFETVLQTGTSADKLLDQTQRAPGSPPDPAESAPYYLLLVGDPATASFELQQELDLRYAVGRLFFDAPDSYGRYAQAVLAAEARALRQRRMLVFGTRHDGDLVTNACVDQLLMPLVGEMASRPGWSVEPTLGPAATRAELQGLIARPEASILLTAAHSPVLEIGDPLQEALHGAIVTSEWAGPERDLAVERHHVVAAADLDRSLDLRGLIVVMVGCFSAGTPRFDGFIEKERVQLAPDPYVAAFPQALLDRGALAVLAHVDSLYLHSFAWPGSSAEAQHQTYGDTLYRLGRGHRLGYAADPFGRRFGDLAQRVLASRLQPERYDDKATAAYWIGYHDARQYVVLGDPAVKLSVPPSAGEPAS